MNEDDDLRPATIAKSDQINADDLIGGSVTVTVRRAVLYDRAEQPVEVTLDEIRGKVWRPCKTMVRALIAVWGPRGSGWVGHRMTLYRDPAVRFGGEGGAEGGIRVSHVTGITAPESISLAVSKGKKSKWTLRPLVEADPLAAVLARKGITPVALDAWLVAKGKPPVSEIDDAARSRLVGWLERSAPIDEIRNSTAREPGQEG